MEQRSKDGCTWQRYTINCPSGLEVAEFRTVLDCWNVMFPFHVFFGDDGVLRWIKPHHIHPFSENEFLQCIGIVLGSS